MYGNDGPPAPDPMKALAALLDHVAQHHLLSRAMVLPADAAQWRRYRRLGGSWACSMVLETGQLAPIAGFEYTVVLN